MGRGKRAEQRGKRRVTRGQAAFTLVELAVVLTIIGLLIGGVLKGQQMLHAAKVSATIKQIQSVKAAVAGFRDRYSQLPGDMANAFQRLPGCDAAANCSNGNGDGAIGSTGSSFTIEGLFFSQAGISSPQALETVQAWKHLALADLITGVSPSAHPLNDLAWGVTHPSSPFTGGLHMQTTALALGRGRTFMVFRDNMEGWVGHGSASSYPCMGHPDPAIAFFCALIPPGFPGAGELIAPPRLVLEIDRKMDDGNPTSGEFAGFCLPSADGMASSRNDCFFWAGIF